MNSYFRSTLAIALWAMLMLGVLPAMAAANVKIPAGTSLQVRINQKLSSETASVGDVFHGSLAAPVVANGRTLFPKGAIVTGEVVNVERSGRLSTPGELHLSLRSIRTGSRTHPVSVQTVVIKGESHTKSNVTKIGGGTALGALIGAVAGGGKGAAIGAGVGAAAGTGVAAGTGKKPAEVQSEAVLAWVAQGTPAVSSTQEQDSRQYSGEPETEEEEHHDNRRYSRDDNRDEDYDGRGPIGFSDRDRQIIGDCFVKDRAGLPPALAKKDHLPPGLERQLQRNGTSGVAEAGAAAAQVVRRSPAAIAEGLVTSGAKWTDHSARSATDNRGLVLVGKRLAGKTLVPCIPAEGLVRRPHGEGG